MWGSLPVALSGGGQPATPSRSSAPLSAEAAAHAANVGLLSAYHELHAEPIRGLLHIQVADVCVEHWQA
jgi:hypothetical protein